MMVATLEVAEYAVVGVDGVGAVALVLPQNVSVRHVAVNGWAPHSSSGVSESSGIRRRNVCHSSWVVVHWASWSSVVMSQRVGELDRGGEGY